LKKSAVRKHWEWGGIKNRQTHRCQLGVASLECLRVAGVWQGCSGDHGGLSVRNNLIEKVNGEIFDVGLKIRRQNEITRQTHFHPLLSGISELGVAATGSDSPCRLREVRQCRQQNSNLIEK
jgi:hypothetical protein